MLKHRLIYGPLMIVALLIVMFLDNRLDTVNLDGTWAQGIFLGRAYPPAGLVMLAFVLVLIFLATRELAQIIHATHLEVDPFMLWLGASLGCLLVYVLPYTLPSQASLAIYASVLVAVFVLALVRHSWGGRTEGAVAAASVTLFALLYLGTLPGFYLAIRRWHSAWVVAAIVIVTKSCDIGAYFTGRAVGRHKLIPWLSPGKTWEGLLGGLILSALVALGLAALANAVHLTGIRSPGATAPVAAYPLWYAALAGLVLGGVGQLGDLTASLFKRDAGFKDSGRSIPGFGGLLDVIDSPIVVAPVAYWLLMLLRVVG